MLRFVVSCSLAFHVQPYLPILDSFLLAVIILVYDDLYGTPVEGSMQHGNVRYVYPCVHE